MVGRSRTPSYGDQIQNFALRGPFPDFDVSHCTGTPGGRALFRLGGNRRGVRRWGTRYAAKTKAAYRKNSRSARSLQGP
jgi:hypothetical protein